MKLKLDQIIIDQGTQIRVAIDQKTVTEYAEAIMHKEVLPPLTVFSDGIKYYLADGFHRYFAYKNTVTPEVEVDVQKGTLRNAIEYALGANSKHGLKRTNEDKKNAVIIALNDIEWGMLGLREIAKLCGVSHTYVSTIKEKMDAEKTVKKEKPKADPVVDTPKATKSEPKKAEHEVEDDELTAILAHQKDLEEENAKLNDRLAVGVMAGTEEEKNKASETIASLREQIRQLEVENMTLKTSRDQYMRENAEMKKQLVYFKRKIQKYEKETV
jgi:hypothetical protein